MTMKPIRGYPAINGDEQLRSILDSLRPDPDNEKSLDFSGRFDSVSDPVRQLTV
jgi:hypothetical protein